MAETVFLRGCLNETALRDLIENINIFYRSLDGYDLSGGLEGVVQELNRLRDYASEQLRHAVLCSPKHPDWNTEIRRQRIKAVKSITINISKDGSVSVRPTKDELWLLVWAAKEFLKREEESSEGGEFRSNLTRLRELEQKSSVGGSASMTITEGIALESLRYWASQQLLKMTEGGNGD